MKNRGASRFSGVARRESPAGGVTFEDFDPFLGKLREFVEN